ncbi:pilus assembly protein PilP [Comamonas antarctica]|uniref:Pilus assembly protein PilP n=1 Tax=Comamonas antarctica TaxID=2743470 RepID=A0A6N1X864_9BURK|nr:pilus assembly protein PilP [Comamonas antarctica]QKV54292.1 pilus assembly protein PilP [Comamonas antarctica]
MQQRSLILALGLCTALLVGCSNPEHEELQQWMAQQRAQARPRITPIAEPKQFQPQTYTADGGVDPFDPGKLTQALRRDSAQQGARSGIIQSELNRRKEPLEAMPLDAMAMVGSLQKQGQPTALIKVDQLLYQVRVGNYLGQNYGKVLRITENSVQLREIIQDVTGEWIERNTELVLQETQK